jgi:hypothetical protein
VANENDDEGFRTFHELGATVIGGEQGLWQQERPTLTGNLQVLATTYGVLY